YRRPLQAGQPGQEALGACVDLRRSFAAGAAVDVELPARPVLPDLRAGQALVVAVVELPKQRRDLRTIEARKLRRPDRAFQVTGIDRRELDAPQEPPQVARLLLTLRQQRQIGAARVLTGVGPGSVTVANQVGV